MKQYCLTLDLKPAPKLIEEYKDYHRRVWPEVRQSILDAGILKLEIYLLGNRLVMFLEAGDDFSFAAKAAADAANAKVQEWETLMWNYQQALPQAAPGEKWILMEPIFSLEKKDRIDVPA
ncbi:MAG TPA: L-rhamnose mutarotase [Acidobacteriaceae bacterium]